MPELVVTCHSDCLRQIRDFVRARALEAHLKRKEVGRLILAVDEVSSNIIRHMYHFDPDHKITVGWYQNDSRIMIEVKDDSPDPFLPLQGNGVRDFDLSTKLSYRHSTGYGKHILPLLVDDIQYETVPGLYNKVTLIKYREGGKEHATLGGARKKAQVPSLEDQTKARSLAFRNVIDLCHHMNLQKTPEELVNLLVYALMGQLSSQPVIFFAPDKIASAMTIVGQSGLKDAAAVGKLGFPRYGWILENLWASRGPVLADEFRKLMIPEEELKTLESLNSAVLIPIFLLNHLKGVVSLGPKKNRIPFSHEEVGLVIVLASHMLLLLETMREEKGQRRVYDKILQLHGKRLPA